MLKEEPSNKGRNTSRGGITPLSQIKEILRDFLVCWWTNLAYGLFPAALGFDSPFFSTIVLVNNLPVFLGFLCSSLKEGCLDSNGEGTPRIRVPIFLSVAYCSRGTLPQTQWAKGHPAGGPGGWFLPTNRTRCVAYEERGPRNFQAPHGKRYTSWLCSVSDPTRPQQILPSEWAQRKSHGLQFEVRELWEVTLSEL